ncbi:uncharacterized protein LOC143277936 [Babylonia areolata]|uniref:uncharacterized protein LOC143277936 n=1 Tax=Babylonia areolata TaxID=304850 RepID=UPI003FD133CE
MQTWVVVLAVFTATIQAYRDFSQHPTHRHTDQNDYSKSLRHFLGQLHKHQSPFEQNLYNVQSQLHDFIGNLVNGHDPSDKGRNEDRSDSRAVSPNLDSTTPSKQSDHDNLFGDQSHGMSSFHDQSEKDQSYMSRSTSGHSKHIDRSNGDALSEDTLDFLLNQLNKHSSQPGSGPTTKRVPWGPAHTLPDSSSRLRSLYRLLDNLRHGSTEQGTRHAGRLQQGGAENLKHQVSKFYHSGDQYSVGGESLVGSKSELEYIKNYPQYRNYVAEKIDFEDQLALSDSEIHSSETPDDRSQTQDGTVGNETSGRNDTSVHPKGKVSDQIANGTSVELDDAASDHLDNVTSDQLDKKSSDQISLIPVSKFECEEGSFLSDVHSGDGRNFVWSCRNLTDLVVDHVNCSWTGERREHRTIFYQCHGSSVITGWKKDYSLSFHCCPIITPSGDTSVKMTDCGETQYEVWSNFTFTVPAGAALNGVDTLLTQDLDQIVAFKYCKPLPTGVDSVHQEERAGIDFDPTKPGDRKRGLGDSEDATAEFFDHVISPTPLASTGKPEGGQSMDRASDEATYGPQVSPIPVSTFECPEGSFLSDIKSWMIVSKFTQTAYRGFLFSCRNLPFFQVDHMNCSWAGEKREHGNTSFQCHDSSVITGWQMSARANLENDYDLSFRCCPILTPSGDTSVKMTDCGETQYEVWSNFTFTVPAGAALNGVDTLLTRFSDRKFTFKYCKPLPTNGIDSVHREEREGISFDPTKPVDRKRGFGDSEDATAAEDATAVEFFDHVISPTPLASSGKPEGGQSMDRALDEGTYGPQVYPISMSTFECPEGSFLSDIKSWVILSMKFTEAAYPGFLFSCRNLPFFQVDHMNCSWAGERRMPGITSFQCHGSSVITGWQMSARANLENDYDLSFRCCPILTPSGDTSVKMTDCGETQYEVWSNFTFTVPAGAALNGVDTLLTQDLDEILTFKYCKPLPTGVDSVHQEERAGIDFDPTKPVDRKRGFGDSEDATAEFFDHVISPTPLASTGKPEGGQSMDRASDEATSGQVSPIPMSTFECPEGSFLSDIKSWMIVSKFTQTAYRGFLFSCRNLPFFQVDHMNCSWAGEKREHGNTSFQCHDSSVITGWQMSARANLENDYDLSFRCCPILTPSGDTSVKMTDCGETQYEVWSNFTFTVPAGAALTGVDTLLTRFSDRKFTFRYCKPLPTNGIDSVHQEEREGINFDPTKPVDRKRGFGDSEDATAAEDATAVEFFDHVISPTLPASTSKPEGGQSMDRASDEATSGQVSPIPVSTFECPEGSFLSDIKSWMIVSKFTQTAYRGFLFSCRNLPFFQVDHMNCSWAGEKREHGNTSFQCHDSSVITGWQMSARANLENDYDLSFRCCPILTPSGDTSVKMTDCGETQYEVWSNFTFTVPAGAALTGVDTLLTRFSDRKFTFRYCKPLPTNGIDSVHREEREGISFDPTKPVDRKRGFGDSEDATAAEDATAVEFFDHVISPTPLASSGKPEGGQSMDRALDEGTYGPQVYPISMSTFECPEGSFLSDIKSLVILSMKFTEAAYPGFLFSCRNLLFFQVDHMNCSWAGERRTPGITSFQCHGSSVITGWQMSARANQKNDYDLSFRCCPILTPSGETSVQMTDCTPTPYLWGNFTFTVPAGAVLHRVDTLLSPFSDRFFDFGYCYAKLLEA